MIKILMGFCHPGPFILLTIFLSLANLINIHVPWFICLAPLAVWLLIVLGIGIGILWTVYLAIVKPLRKFIKK